MSKCGFGPARTPTAPRDPFAMLAMLAVFAATVKPFVVADPGGGLGGFDIDLTREVLRVAGLPAGNLTLLPSIPDVLAAVEAANHTGVGDGVDDVVLGVGSITINAARERRLDFLPSYFQSGLRVMAHSTRDFNAVAGRVLRNLFVAIGLFLAGMLVIVSVMSPIVFALESVFVPHRQLPIFWRPNDGDTRLERMGWGLLRATGWTLFTIFGTQTSYPKSMPSRVVHGGNKMLAVLLVIVATAAVTTVFVVSTSTTEIDGYNDLAGHRVCTVEGTTSHTYMQLNPRGFRTVLARDAESMFAAFWRRECDAAVYDFPVMQAEILRRRNGGYSSDAELVGDVFRAENYGIAAPHDSPHEERLRRAVLDVLDNESFMSALHAKYLDESAGSAGEGEGLSVPVAWIVVPCLMGLGVTVVVMAVMWRTFDDRHDEYEKTLRDAQDDNYEDDLEALRKLEVFNDSLYYGVDWSTEQIYELAMRAVRVTYQLHLALVKNDDEKADGADERRDPAPGEVELVVEI